MDPATTLDRDTHHGHRCRIPYMALLGLSPIRAVIEGPVAVAPDGKRCSVYDDARETVLLTLHVSLIDGPIELLDPERTAT